VPGFTLSFLVRVHACVGGGVQPLLSQPESLKYLLFLWHLSQCSVTPGHLLSFVPVTFPLAGRQLQAQPEGLCGRNQVLCGLWQLGEAHAWHRAEAAAEDGLCAWAGPREERTR
jgi:hypothetical protein